ncbi:hypothetical protein GJA_2282 [Janthinobacterium agaricidamnosum NBRC 102515 = DSM 9628]|uniref:Transmembrane protein n=2 Tax=Janthinobacterium agaricidamnosum TaxID=55508 RepID=W0V4X0_9BURK|nr:hypothetical protein GJA_2282 [Janthinobacterium agaricidamnosum NBRC 102515 = DSM 9628]
MMEMCVFKNVQLKKFIARQHSRNFHRIMWHIICTVLSFPFLACAMPISIFTENDNFMSSIKKSGNTGIESLEIVGVGISVETWRNHPGYPKLNLWKAVDEGNGAYIISQDPQQYPHNIESSGMMSAKRKEDAVETAMRDFMDCYPLPIAIVGPALQGSNKESDKHKVRESNADSFVVTKDSEPYTSEGEFAGLLTQSGQVMNSYLNDNPDKLWNTIFMTFDEHGDLPAVGVAAKDGAFQRTGRYYFNDRPKFNDMAELAYHPKNVRTPTDSWTFLTLIRRGRIDWLRSFAPLVEDNMTIKNWPAGPSRNRSEFVGWNKEPDQPFVPTPFIPKPWTRFQIDQYDHLENLGTLYRPQVVSYLDDHGQPVKPAERRMRMEAALRAALAPLGGKSPARIFFDYGSVLDDRNGAARFLPLVQSLQAIDDNFNLLDPRQGYDLARILGDIGAGSPFIAVALATMAGRQSGGATLVANMRRDDGATLLLVTPPSAAQIKKDAAIQRPFWPRPGFGKLRVSEDN